MGHIRPEARGRGFASRALKLADPDGDLRPALFIVRCEALLGIGLSSLIDANQARIVSGDPDVIFPGQTDPASAYGVAFDLLSGASQHRNVPVRVLASR